MSAFYHPSWCHNSNIYEVNIRQYSYEGSFMAFEKHLPRLADMGVEILWLMPVTPISAKGMKGTLGSYYAARSFRTVNPEFGTMQDLKDLVNAAHRLGLRVIIDWVANHTGNDHDWISQHPAYFSYDDAGEIIHPHGWEDVSKLNFENQEMRRHMISAMQFWIDEADIDGFRCDMAHLVPLDFWQHARTDLDAAKPGLFWLAECEEMSYHQVFDVSYTWKWMHITETCIRNNEGFNNVLAVLKEYDQYPADALRVFFTSNHDENSWNGTEYEKYGDAALPLAVFTCTWNGLPMLYSGQELPNYKRLKFFDKDEIEWSDEIRLHDFYATLLKLRKQHPALRAGDVEVSTQVMFDEAEPFVFGFVRRKGEDVVVVLLNFSGESKKIKVPVEGTFKNIFDGALVEVGGDVELPHWGYLVFAIAQVAGSAQIGHSDLCASSDLSDS